jgi:hypothetical protein
MWSRRRNYWYETISRKEALRRLKNRKLHPPIRAEIESKIPEQTRHFLTFKNGAFREYADFGKRGAKLLLILPMEKKGDVYVVEEPIHTTLNGWKMEG